MNPAEGGRSKVTDKPGEACDPASSPTGHKIAYSGHDGNDSEIYKIYTIDPGGAGTYKVTDNDTDDLYLSYSPSGKKIAYLGDTPVNPAVYKIDSPTARFSSGA